jgi:hypothetical protein
MAACFNGGAVEPGVPRVALLVRADVSATAVASLVVVVTAADIPNPLVFNILLANGVASGTIDIPAGSSRTITMHAYDANGIETHRSVVTVSIRSGTNPTIPFVLTSLTGDVPIDATLSSVGVTVGPAVATLPILATAELTATIVDANGAPVSQPVSWATRNPGIAIVTSTGDRTAQVTAVGPGSTDIEATFGGSAGSTAIVVSPPGPVFPGAEGFGTTTLAGRGGQVIHVTNLNDAGPGSFREAVSAAGPRTVIFDVSGNIRLTSRIIVALASGADDPGDGTRDFLTIAGQTAPSPGITLVIDGTSAQGGLYIRTNDVLIQHIRIRADMSTAGSHRMDCLTLDGARIVVDHVTTTWTLASDVGGGAGKLMSTGGAGPFTISNSLIAESIYGLLVQADGVISVIRTLFAFNFDRNPQLNGGNHDLILNTVVYSPGDASRPFFAVWGGSSAAPNLSNYIGNKFIAGATYPLATIQYGSVTDPMIAGSRTYIQDNILGAPPIFNDGNIVQVGSPTITLPSPLTILSSGQVEAYVLAHAGARPLDRDAVDTRIINDVSNRTDNRDATVPTLAQNTRVLSIPANQATIRPSGYSVLEEDILFPLARSVEGAPEAIPSAAK